MSEGRKIMQVRSARQVPVRVQLLDDEILDLTVDKRAVGWILFDKVCEHLNVLEKDYFALNFINPEGLKYWLDQEKKISKQMKGLQALNLCFEVKFYPSDPLQMVEDLTRYQLCLQIRRDIVNERVPCSTVTYALLGSFTAQSELGDFEVEEFGSGSSYLKDLQFAPHQDRDLLSQIAKLHRSHKGLTPEDAELKFLENAKKLALYGVELHPARDAEGKDIQLGVCASGILVYKDKQQVNRFVWPKILKMSYRRNKFYIKIRPGEFENFASLIGFRTSGIKMAKRLWKICVEHHSFFRFKEPEPVKSFSVIPRFGSRFRYSGRTQYQSRHIVSEEARDAPFFDRVLSKRGTFGGRTNNMRQRDDDRKRQREEMRRQPPPVQDFKPPQKNGGNDLHVEPRPSPKESKRPPPEPRHSPPEPRHSPPQMKKVPPEPKHAPPIAPKPKPNIAPKPKPSPRGPPSVDDNTSLDRGSRGSLNDSFEDIPDRKSKMEKMHAVMTPLAMVMQKSLEKKDLEESDEEDRHSYNNHMDDKYEVGMNAHVASTRSGLINTNKGGRNKDGYLFSYPSSSVDSILSNDFDEYATDSQYQLGQRVASDEHLNASGTGTKIDSKQRSSYTGFSQSAENILIEGNVSHYDEIDPVTAPEGIYAEIDDVKINNSRNPNKLTNNKEEKRIIRGRRSLLFKPNQKQNIKQEKSEIAPLKSLDNEANETVLKLKEQKGKQLTRPKSFTPHYSQVNKKHKEKSTPENSHEKEHTVVPHTSISKQKQGQSKDIEITSVEPHYDKIDNKTETGHKRQDSQTSQASLKEELKMYIITPEKLRQSSEVNSMKKSNDKSRQMKLNTNSQKGNENLKAIGNDDNSHISQESKHKTSSFDCRPDNEIVETCKGVSETLEKMSKDVDAVTILKHDTLHSENVFKGDGNDRVKSNLNTVEPLYRNQDLDDTDVSDDTEMIQHMDSASARSMTSLYQLTFDSCSPTPREQPDGLQEELDNDETTLCNTNDTDKSKYIISAISFDSEKNSSFIHDTSLNNSERLEESLELFCNLSSDSSDFEQPPNAFKREDSKRVSTLVKKKRHSDKGNNPKITKTEQDIWSGNESLSNPTNVKNDTTSTKPKSLLKNVTSLVKKVPVLGKSRSSKKKEFVCEQFDREPGRRVAAPLEPPSMVLENKTPNTLSEKTLHQTYKAKNVKVDTEKLTQSSKGSLLHDNSTESNSTALKTNEDACSEGVLNKRPNGDQQLMEFFERPKLFEDFHSSEIAGQSNQCSNKSGNHFANVADSRQNISEPKERGNDQILEQTTESRPIDKTSAQKFKDGKSAHIATKPDNYKSIVSKEECADQDTEIQKTKAPDPYWYRTHLLPSKSEISARELLHEGNENKERSTVMGNPDTEVDDVMVSVSNDSDNCLANKTGSSEDCNKRSQLLEKVDSIKSPNVSMQSHSNLRLNERDFEEHVEDSKIKPEINGTNVIETEADLEPVIGGRRGENRNNKERLVNEDSKFLPENTKYKSSTRELETGPEILKPPQHDKGAKPEVVGSHILSKEIESGPEIRIPVLYSKDIGTKTKGKHDRDSAARQKLFTNETETGPTIRRPMIEGNSKVPEVIGSKVYVNTSESKSGLLSKDTEIKQRKVISNKADIGPRIGSKELTKSEVLSKDIEVGPEITRPVMPCYEVGTRVGKNELQEKKMMLDGFVGDQKNVTEARKSELHNKDIQSKEKDKKSVAKSFVERSVVYNKSIKQGPVVKEFTFEVNKTEPVPLVKGSKVYNKEIETGPEIRFSKETELLPGPCNQVSQVFNRKKESTTDTRKSPLHGDKFRSENTAGIVKPIYKLDYSSDSSSSISSTVQKRPKSKDQGNSSFESQGNLETHTTSATKKKVSPGVVHMVRPGPASWIEGGLNVSLSKKSRKQPESKRFVSVLDSDRLPTTSVPEIPCSKLDFDGTSSINSKGNESPGDIPSNVQVEEGIGSTDKDLEMKGDTFSEGNPSGPMTELLCKRVWKYPKNKSTNSDRDTGSDFVKAVEKGPEYNDETDMASDNTCENSNMSEKNDNSAKQDPLISNVQEDNPVGDNKKESIDISSQNISDKEQSSVHDETKDCTGNNKHNQNVSEANTNYEMDVLNKSVKQIQETDLDSDSLNNDQYNEESSKELLNTNKVTKLPSKDDFPYLDSSSESESSTAESSCSEDEIVTFEMPKPSGDGFKDKAFSDIPFMDEQYDNSAIVDDNGNSMTSGSTPHTGFAIDCSLEDVTLYKVSDKNMKNQENNALPGNSELYSNTMSIDDDRYDVNYWDEDIGFDDYDDSFIIQGYMGAAPEVVDNTPYIPKRSNLKNSLRHETTFSERRVHFPGNLPVYKSRKNIEQTEELMNANNEENSKINHLQQFIFGLFDEEPRNRCIPRANSSPISVNARTDEHEHISSAIEVTGRHDCASREEAQSYLPLTSMADNDKGLGFHSALTFENVNFSLSPLEYYSIYDRDRRTDVITTDLDELDYNDEGFDPSIACPTNTANTCETNKTETKASPRILKPVIGRKTKYSNAEESDYDKQNSYFDDVISSAIHHSESIDDNNLGEAVYMSECSAELTDPIDPNSNSTPNPLNQVNINSTRLPLTDSSRISPLQTDEIKSNRYIDVSELGNGKKTVQQSEQPDNDSMDTEEQPCVTVQTGSKPVDKVTKISYSYADDSDPESPKIKYVTYEYVTEYKLNNVKIQYQYNKKVQTDSRLSEIASGTLNHSRVTSTECQTDVAARTVNKGVGNESTSIDNGFGEVLEEAIEPFITKTFCIPLEEDEALNENRENKNFDNYLPTQTSGFDQKEVLEEAIEPFITRSICIPLEEDQQDEKEVLEEAVEPFIRTSVCVPLGEGEGKEDKTGIEVEEVIEQAVCYPLGPIEGISSGHPFERGKMLVEEHIERSVCHTLGNKTSAADLGNQESTQKPGDCSHSNKTLKFTGADNHNDDKKGQGKVLQEKCPNDESEIDRDDVKHKSNEGLPRQTDKQVLGKGYTEKQVVEHESEKYVFQCYQPTSYASSRFPIYFPLNLQNKQSNKTNKQSENIPLNSKHFKDTCTGKPEPNATQLTDESNDKITENSLQLEVLETLKDLQDSGYETFNDEQLMENETDTEDQLGESVAIDGNDNIFSEIMQEELPNLHVEQSTEERLFVAQAMAVLAIGTVLVFFLPYIG